MNAHYIPESYLKLFTDKKGVLWVWEKGKPIRPSRPKDEGSRPDYYTHTNNGTHDETAEDALGMIESQAAPILKKIRNPEYRLTPETAGNLYLFAALMFARVPSMREYLDTLVCAAQRHDNNVLANDKERWEESCRRYERDTGRSLGDVENLRQYVLNGKYRLTQESVPFNLGAMFKVGFLVMDKLMRCNYEVLYAPAGSYFVTSDSPVCTVLRKVLRNKTKTSFGWGLDWPGVHVFFPLNKRACLRLSRDDIAGVRQISAEAVSEINQYTMFCATSQLYVSAPDDELRAFFDEWGCAAKPGVNAFMTTQIEEHLSAGLDSSSA